nr:hypothetical protein [Candidatus Arsenophonus triatominarum]
MTVFKFTAKNGRIDYRVTNKDNPTRQYVKSIMDARWSVREVKQNCGIERCQARTSRAQRIIGSVQKSVSYLKLKKKRSRVSHQ